IDALAAPASPDDLPLSDVRGHNSNHYPLSLAALPGARLGLRLHYNAAVFDACAIEAIAARLVRLLEQIAAEPSRPIHSLTILAAEEREQLLVAFNDTAAVLPETTLGSLFAAQAARTPERIALCC